MNSMWQLVVPDPQEGKKSAISPLLGDVESLPPHLIFVAGQDPLRDEAIAYAKKLEGAGVNVRMTVYPGVQHDFGTIWELEATKRFWMDLERGMQQLLDET